MKSSKADYLETSELVSPTFPPTKGSCLKFWFVVPTEKLYRLSIHLRSAGTLHNPLWGISKTSVLQWHGAHINVVSDLPFEVIQVAF